MGIMDSETAYLMDKYPVIELLHISKKVFTANI